MKKENDKRVEEDICEILDITGTSENSRAFLQEVMKSIKGGSAAMQLTVGGITGWCAGFLFTKVGKFAATAVGGSLLIFQLAQHHGYIQVNWPEVNKNLDDVTKRLRGATNKRLPRLVEETKRFAKDNVFLATGFAGGFLLGVAST